jgi:hypothetical protein
MPELKAAVAAPLSLTWHTTWAALAATEMKTSPRSDGKPWRAALVMSSETISPTRQQRAWSSATEDTTARRRVVPRRSSSAATLAWQSRVR